MKAVNELIQFIERFLPNEIAGIAGAVAVLILALVFAFFGYKAMRVFSTLVGLFIGAVAGYGIASALKLPFVWTLVIPAVLAVGLAVLAWFFYKGGIFVLILFAAAFVAFTFVHEYAGIDRVVIEWVIAGIIGAVFAVLTMIVYRPLLIISSALTGGYVFSTLLFSKVHIPDAKTNMICVLTVGGVLFLDGIYPSARPHGVLAPGRLQQNKRSM